MHHVRLALVALVSIGILAHASASVAQVGAQKETANFAMTGLVKAVDAAKNSITVEGAAGEGGTLEVDPKAMIKDNSKKQIPLSAVKAGWRVVLNGDLRAGPGGDAKTAKKVVTYIEVVDAP